MELKERVDLLTDELLKAQKAYYVDGRPVMSDTEYDRLFDELSRIESQHRLSRSCPYYTRSLARQGLQQRGGHLLDGQDYEERVKLPFLRRGRED